MRLRSVCYPNDPWIHEAYDGYAKPADAPKRTRPSLAADYSPNTASTRVSAAVAGFGLLAISAALTLAGEGRFAAPSDQAPSPPAAEATITSIPPAGE